MQDTVARLPTALRETLKEPMGPVVTDVDTLLDGVDGPIVAIGDIVTFHLLEAGCDPAVAVLDGRSERSQVAESIRASLPLDQNHVVPNEPATLSAELVAALTTALGAGDGHVIIVDGEEDLAALPAIVAAPTGAVVVYGQPGEGMVRVIVDDDTRSQARNLLEQFEDTDRLWALLPREPPSKSF